MPDFGGDVGEADVQNTRLRDRFSSDKPQIDRDETPMNDRSLNASNNLTDAGSARTHGVKCIDGRRSSLLARISKDSGSVCTSAADDNVDNTPAEPPHQHHSSLRFVHVYRVSQKSNSPQVIELCQTLTDHPNSFTAGKMWWKPLGYRWHFCK